MKTRSKLILLLLALLVITPRLAAQDAPNAGKKALFWKVSSANNAIYLLGSIHAGSKEMFPLPTEIESAFDNSTALLVEFDINHVDEEKMQWLVKKRGVYTGSDVLWNHVDAQTKVRLEQACSKYGFRAEGLAKMKPWLAELMIGVRAVTQMGMDPALGIDRYFLDKAGKSEDTKRVVSIESAEWQLNLISGFPDEVQASSLASSLEDLTRMPEMLKLLVDAWLRGDSDGLDKLMHESDERQEEVIKAMLHDRNRHMADVAEVFLKGKQQSFVVVGAAHMVGYDGVVRLLEERGYKVEQVAIK